MAAFSEASFFSFLWVPQSASNTALQEVSQQQYVVHQTFLPLIFSTIVFNGNTFASFICPSNYLISVQTLKKKKKKKKAVRSLSLQQCSSTALLHTYIPTARRLVTSLRFCSTSLMYKLRTPKTKKPAEVCTKMVTAWAPTNTAGTAKPHLNCVHQSLCPVLSLQV